MGLAPSGDQQRTVAPPNTQRKDAGGAGRTRQEGRYQTYRLSEGILAGETSISCALQHQGQTTSLPFLVYMGWIRMARKQNTDKKNNK